MEAPNESPLEDYQVSRRQLLRDAAGLLAAGMLLPSCGGESDKLEDLMTPHITMEKKEIIGETDLLAGGLWEHMAGAQIVPGGLELASTGLAIVNKREKGRIYPNPPLNVYGIRLQAEGDFSISAHTEGEAPVALQLYGLVPLRFDDFRYERSRLECLVSGNKLTVNAWDGSKQEPVESQAFSFTGSSASRQLEVRREGKELVFIVNGRRQGSIAQGELFETGEVWLGLNSEQGNTHVSQLTAQPLHGHKLETVDTSSLRVTKRLREGLQSLVSKQDFHIGAAVALNPLVSDPHYTQLFLGGEVGSITTENALKPQDIQPREGKFTFDEADALVELAARHDVAVHGHALVYDKAMPKWMQELPYETEAEKQRVREVLEKHVKTVVSRYKGRITSWDVVNEAIAEFNDKVHFEKNIWFRALGEEYIDIAFRAAHEADPDAKLYINDFGMETNYIDDKGQVMEGRGQFMLDFVKRAKARGVPIHGVGIQGHVYEIERDKIKPKVLTKLMHEFEKMDVAVRVTELDVTGANGPEAQARQYAEVLQACLAARNCTGLTIWGLTDSYGSTAGVEGIKLKLGNALPYTAGYHEKLARKIMREVLINSR